MSYLARLTNTILLLVVVAMISGLVAGNIFTQESLSRVLIQIGVLLAIASTPIRLALLGVSFWKEKKMSSLWMSAGIALIIAGAAAVKLWIL